MFMATVAASTPETIVSKEYIKLDRQFLLDKESRFAQKAEKVVREPSPPTPMIVNIESFKSIIRPKQNEPMVLTVKVPLQVPKISDAFHLITLPIAARARKSRTIIFYSQTLLVHF